MQVHSPLLFLTTVLALMTGCGGAGSKSGSDKIDGTPTINPGQQLDSARMVLSLADGRVTALAPGQTATVQTGTVLLVQVLGGTMELSTVDQVDPAGLNDGRTSRTLSTFHIGAYELTQAQWAALVTASGADVPAAPWNEVAPAEEFGSAIGEDKPAYGLSAQMIQTVLDAWNAKRLSNIRLRMPGVNEWEFACRGGPFATWARFSWGDSEDPGVAQTYARVRDTAGGTRGAGTVGARQPNRLGLYDMHGNVWEWVFNGGGPNGTLPLLRGGSWADNLLSAASGNRFPVAAEVPFGLAGVRLVAWQEAD